MYCVDGSDFLLHGSLHEILCFAELNIFSMSSFSYIKKQMNTLGKSDRRRQALVSRNLSNTAMKNITRRPVSPAVLHRET